jgi:predicted RecA/RadA family phage recombinase
MISARTSLRLLSVVFLALALSAFAPISDFSGAYTLGAAVASGKDVQLTIMLTVANNTSSSISNATISLHEPKAGRVVYGQLAGVSLASGSSTQVSGSFRIPQGLYQSWQKGSSPAMSVAYSDAQGNPVQTFIQF